MNSNTRDALIYQLKRLFYFSVLTLLTERAIMNVFNELIQNFWKILFRERRDVNER
jgi:hypothetical protein